MDIQTLHMYFDLDSLRGVIRWKIRPARSVRIGSEAGAINGHGYRQLRLNGENLQLHRIVFAMTHGRWPEGPIDHINRVRLDNRPENLRESTFTQNRRNAGLRCNNRSGTTGVRFNKRNGQWHAYIKTGSVQTHLGFFPTSESAIAARHAAERERCGGSVGSR